jgi:hypothetical protein
MTYVPSFLKDRTFSEILFAAGGLAILVLGVGFLLFFAA